MILSLGYKKRKNIELFSSFEKEFQISNYKTIYLYMIRFLH